MRVMAQMAMVMNLDKCIGCHTCSVTCKQAWTNRAGIGVRLVQQRRDPPGPGLPPPYEDQDKWEGGWTLGRNGRLSLQGGRAVEEAGQHLLEPQAALDGRLLRALDVRLRDLISAPAQQHFPVARPISLISGKAMKVPGRPTGTTTWAAATRTPAATSCSRASPTR